jgi:hypothetical protein
VIAVDLSSVANEFVLEVFSNAIGGFLNSARLSEDCAFELALIARRDAALDCPLEIAVEVLAGIQLRRIWRQVKDLDTFRVCRQPVLYRLRFVYVPRAINKKRTAEAVPVATRSPRSAIVNQVPPSYSLSPSHPGDGGASAYTAPNQGPGLFPLPPHAQLTHR